LIFIAERMVDCEHKDDYEEYFQSCEDYFLDDA
jgi:hypothetical protein